MSVVVIVVRVVNVINGDILEEHVLSDESVDIDDVSVKWEAQRAAIENSVSVANIFVAVVAVQNVHAIAFAPLSVDVVVVDVVIEVVLQVSHVVIISMVLISVVLISVVPSEVHVVVVVVLVHVVIHVSVLVSMLVHVVVEFARFAAA